MLAAILRGWIDQVLSRFVDVLMAIPSLIFALMLLSIFGSTVLNLIIIIAVLDSTRVFRLSRAVGMNVAVMEYVEAARLRGEKIGWIMRREILPNIIPQLVCLTQIMTNLEMEKKLLWEKTVLLLMQVIEILTMMD